MIGGLLARIAGPRVLLGVVVAAGVALSFVTWRWLDTREDAASASRSADEYRQALAAAESELERARAERERLDAVIRRQRERRADAQRQAEAARRALETLEEADDEVAKWSGAAVPDSVQRWVHDCAPGADEGGTGCPTDELVSGLPGTADSGGDQRGDGAHASGAP